MLRRILFMTLFIGFSTVSSAQEVVPTLRELRPLYPTPMSKSQVSELLNKAAQRHPGWAMLRKEHGNNCPTPSGKKISCDWLINYTSQWGYDVLRDSDGVAIPQESGGAAIAPGTELVLPWDTDFTPIPTPAPTPTPTPPVNNGQLDRIEAQLARTASRLQGIEGLITGLDVKLESHIKSTEAFQAGVRDEWAWLKTTAKALFRYGPFVAGGVLLGGKLK